MNACLSRRVSTCASHHDVNNVDLARFALQGRSLVLIGGDDRPDQRRRIKRIFALNACDWIETRERRPSAFKVGRVIEGYDVVVLLIGLARHQHGSDVRELCRQLHKPIVVCWRTPHPNHLAHAICSQNPHLFPKKSI